MRPSEEAARALEVESRRHGALVRLLRAIHVASERAHDRGSAVAAIVPSVCEYIEFDLGHAHLYDVENDVLAPTNVWTERDPDRHSSLISATASKAFTPREALPGRALQNGRVEWVSNLTDEPAFARGPWARDIRAGVWVPMYQNGQVGGVLEFFSASSMEPSDEVQAVLEFVGRALSRVMGLAHLEEKVGSYTERFRALVASASDAIVLSDDLGRIIDWNPAAESIFGYTAEEAIGHPVGLIIPDHHRDEHERAFARAVEDDGRQAPASVMAVEGLTRDGRQIPIELSLAKWGNGRKYFAGIMRDVSERHAAERELRLIGSAIAHVRDAIVVSTVGTGGRGPTILYANAAFTKMTGYTEPEVLGQGFSLLAGEDTDRDALHDINRRISRGEAVAAELTVYRRDGTAFLVEWQASPIYEPDGSIRHVASIQRDITEERRVEQALRRVDRDPLTGLANRKILEQRLERCIERARDRAEARFAVLFLDLDGFKAVNDDHGHMVGDQLLTAVAGRLKRTIRPGDTLSRFGGDEFVVLLSYVGDVSDVTLVVDRIRERLSATFDIGGVSVRLAASIGVALSETGYEAADDVLRDADAAMYEAKRKGKGRVEFHDRDLYVDVVEELGLVEDLKRCVDEGQLALHYQPLVELGTRAITGFEALVRWNHPELGLLPPERFIGLAEQSGLIVPMGRWILNEACREAAQWAVDPATGRPLTLSVNLSAAELSDPDVVETIEGILEETGLDPDRLQLELTESVLVKSLQSVRSRLDRIRNLGVRVCIDDFGTGYSSLGYLRHFPVDKLKIDRVFVQQLDASPDNVEILNTIVTLASRLGLEVVAEGIETEAELETLQGMECSFGQGFFFSRPIPSGHVGDYIHARAADRAAKSPDQV